jgi:hypothetical protein
MHASILLTMCFDQLLANMPRPTESEPPVDANRDAATSCGGKKV